MQRHMPTLYFGIVALICFLAACAQDEKTAVAGVEVNSDIVTAGDIVISVELAPALETLISVSSAVGTRPGIRNPVETTITLKNESAQAQVLEMQGDWYDARGNRYGGSRSTPWLDPNGTIQVCDAKGWRGHKPWIMLVDKLTVLVHS